jgi:hypothetical protein
MGPAFEIINITHDNCCWIEEPCLPNLLQDDWSGTKLHTCNWFTHPPHFPGQFIITSYLIYDPIISSTEKKRACLMTNIATCYSKTKKLIVTAIQITQTMHLQHTQMKLVVTNSPSCLAIVHTINFTLHITSIKLKGPATSKAPVSNIFSQELLENGWNSKPNLGLQQKAERWFMFQLHLQV